MDRELLSDPKRKQKVFSDLRFIYAEDSPKEKQFFESIFTTLVELLGRPFHSGSFDFSNKDYFEELYSFGEKLSMMKELRESKKPRGVRDAIYINRTYFGLYTMLHDLKATIKTKY
jgi:hypothetical protein